MTVALAEHDALRIRNKVVDIAGVDIVARDEEDGKVEGVIDFVAEDKEVGDDGVVVRRETTSLIKSSVTTVEICSICVG